MTAGPSITLTLPFGDPGGDPKYWIGWREWASLPELGFDRLQVKIDTGAKTSSLHVWRIEPAGMADDETGDPTPLLRLTLDGDATTAHKKRVITVPLLRHAMVVDSSGRRERRAVFRTRIVLGPVDQTIEVNVTNRESMRFRMILGRTALENHFLVDVNREFLLGEPGGANR
ncbi:MAG: RimK/LysX family protein [Candidatus Sumerlaeota bacterium]|nr:RimK/LysX family protein [Candidatus Sumerlaeota bacterium]